MGTPLSGKLGDHIVPPSARTSGGALEENTRICISEVPSQEIVSISVLVFINLIDLSFAGMLSI